MEDVKTLLREMLLIDSSHIDGANHTVEFCCQWLKEHGLQTLIFENNGYKMLLCEIGSGDQTIVFNGHVDVVSGKKEQFIPREQDGLLFGRGAADMKAGVAAMMCAVAALKDEPLGVKIQLQIVSDEEIGGYNCTAYLVENGYTGDFVICSEPTQLGIALQAKGVLHLNIEVGGKPAHGSRPWEGDNAILKACKLHEEILKLPFMSESSEYYPYPSVNWAKVTGGDVYNKVPDSCTMSLDIRYLPGQDAKTITSQIQTITDGTITVKVTGPPVETQRDNSFIKLLSPVIEAHTNHPVEYFGQHGAADTHFFASKGIPAIEFGPSGANWHGNDEYVVISSLNTYKNMLVDFARKC